MLNALEKAAGKRFSGLAAASTHLRRQHLITSKAASLVRSLHEAYSLERHWTQLGSQHFCDQILAGITDTTADRATSPDVRGNAVDPSCQHFEISSVTVSECDSIPADFATPLRAPHTPSATFTDAAGDQDIDEHLSPIIVRGDYEDSLATFATVSDDSSFMALAATPGTNQSASTATSTPAKAPATGSPSSGGTFHEVPAYGAQRGNFATAHCLDLEYHEPVDLYDPTHASEPRPPAASPASCSRSTPPSPRALSLEIGAGAPPPRPTTTSMSSSPFGYIWMLTMNAVVDTYRRARKKAGFSRTDFIHFLLRLSELSEFYGDDLDYDLDLYFNGQSVDVIRDPQQWGTAAELTFTTGWTDACTLLGKPKRVSSSQ
jgi:hypothetical protein